MTYIISSNDSLERALIAVDDCRGSRRHLALRFGPAVSTISRLLQLRRQTGSSDPGPQGDGTVPTLAPNQDC